MHRILIIVLVVMNGCKNDNLNTETKVNTISIKDTVLLSNGFDFPIGGKDGKNGYTSMIDQKKYNSWYISTPVGDSDNWGIHTGEDWNGIGGGNTDAGQTVYSIAKGLVLEIQPLPINQMGKTLMVKHSYLENDSIKTVYAVYAHLKTIQVNVGDTIMKGQAIDNIFDGMKNGKNEMHAHLHLEIRKSSMSNYPLLYWPSLDGKDKAWINSNYEIPSDFINKHRNS